jgi:signal transduction histidine kinase
VPGRPRAAGVEEHSPILFSLQIAWVSIALAIVSVGLLLKGAISLSQRRAAFVSSVTHELRSPLTTFRMYTEMLVEGMAADPAKQSQYLQTLYRESNRLVHLVENVLSYARLEKGRYGDRETVSIDELVDRTRERLAEHARLAGMQLLVRVESQAGLRLVRVDVSAIERILFNLVDNSCKYARSTDPRIHLDVSSDDRWTRISVRDHGPGIDRRRTRRLFTPFRKTVAEAAKSAPGIGIGLSLSRRLAKAAGGRLVIVECKDGACLRLEMPLAASSSAGAA